VQYTPRHAARPGGHPRREVNWDRTIAIAALLTGIAAAVPPWVGFGGAPHAQHLYTVHIKLECSIANLPANCQTCDPTP